ncbi:hypothetical protein [Alkalicoccus halolimnae]|uniref:Uncharacterized protein n=1 Tax=Alkalicoccus halolimnae TaxID=1667239 RepID=A0A5C7F4G3_9BACI|nr:hypothetical protein [Alkalicoccus halolimnae]TXF84644.1 hypothetical protein FTX54_10615 [Alkalicoccus halolimnae]
MKRKVQQNPVKRKAELKKLDTAIRAEKDKIELKREMIRKYKKSHMVIRAQRDLFRLEERLKWLRNKRELLIKEERDSAER